MTKLLKFNTLALILGLIYLIPQGAFAQTPSAQLALSTSSTTAAVGSNIDVTINLVNAQQAAIDGVDVYALNYTTPHY